MPKQKGSEELIIEAKAFFETYKKEIGESIRKGKKVIFINFEDLSANSPTLAEALISSPEEILQVLEIASEETGLIKLPRIRLNNLPETQKVKIRTVRSQHLNQFIYFEGLVRQTSEVRPQVVNAKFECPSCGTVISVLQVEKKFREPSRCSCGRKGQFRLISKTMVDAQRLVIEESPESLTGGEQPRRLSVFLKEDLVEPGMEEKTTPGSKVKIIGILKEVSIPLPTGAISTRFDLAVEANNIIPLESSYEDLEISEEDERQIQELAADPELFKKLRDSIASSIWGYEEIKEALVLQMFSGIRKVSKTDGSVSRGDIHLLLIGDPGVAKSLSKEDKVMYISEDEAGYESLDKIYDKFKRFPKNLKVLTIDMKNHNLRWENVSEIIKHLPEKELIKITTEHGKQITGTKDHSFITMSKKGEIISIKGDELTKNSYVPIPINYHKEQFKIFKSRYFNKKITNSKILPDKIDLDKDFGFFVGIFLAEGYIQNEEIINISNTNKEIQNRVINFSKKLGLNYAQNKKGVSLFSSNLCRILKFNCYNPEELKNINKGTKGNYFRIKKIPGFMHFAPKEFIYSLLSGLFSGDGRLIQDKKMLKGFELVTISKNLAENASDILFSIGILNKIRSKKYNYKDRITDCYYVSIPTYMISKFLENIEIIGRKIKLNKNNPIYSYNNLIPCGDLVYQVVKKLGYNSRISGNRTIAAEMRTVKKRNELEKLRLLRLIKEFESKSKETISELEILKKIANSNIVWSKIKEIKVLEKKNEEVYDLSVPSTNTFVANGIGVHNSQVLKFVSDIAPKGRYVVGMGASGKGITATVVRDEFLKGWSLEAGAMVLANHGVICIDEIEKMTAEDRSAMHEALEQQCYHYNTIITLADGSEKKIGEIVEELLEKNKGNIIQGKDCLVFPTSKLEVLTTDFKNIFKTKINRISKHKAFDKFIKIKFSNGRNILVTPEHPVFTVENAKIITKRADSVKIGDPIPIPLIIPIAGEQQKFNIDIKNKRAIQHINIPKSNCKEIFKIAGYFIAEGSREINRKKLIGINFTNKDQRLLDDFENLMKFVFNLFPYKQAKIDKHEVRYMYRYTSRELAEFLIKNMPEMMKTSGEKQIPQALMKGEKQNIAQLLSTMFEGDGHVSIKKRTIRIGYSTKSRRLAEQVQDLLLRFGIRSNLNEDREYFKVLITSYDNLQRFLEKISFITPEKNQIIKNYLKEKTIRRTVKDIIPKEFSEKIINIIKQENIRQVEKYKKYDIIYDHSIRKDKFSFSRRFIINLLKQIKKQENIDFLESLTKDIGWEKVVGIEVIENEDEDWVYDITIEPSHAFVSNGAILHNTVTISKANVQACYSEDTEVLTEEGWKKYQEVKNLKIAQFNTKTKTIKFLPHKGLFVYDYKGEMFNFKNKRNNILVTPNHKMLIREERHKKYQEINAENISYSRIRVLNAGEIENKNTRKIFILPPIKHKQNRTHIKYTHQHSPKKIPMDLWLEFLGYYITEGGVETSPTIGIVQKKGKNADKIEKCLFKLSEYIGFTLSKIDCNPYIRFKITNTQLYSYLKKLGKKSYEKKLNINFSEYSKENLKILYKAMMLGDGSKGEKSFGSTSEKLINTFQAIACLIGKSASKSLHYIGKNRGNRKDMYRITLSDKKELCIRKNMNHIKKINYNGKVFCFSTKTGFFITKRNGKIAVQGNTLTAQTSVLAAGNPKYGRFEPTQSITGQIDLPPALINRFDLIFVLRDLPNTKQDLAIATHVLDSHQMKGRKSVIDRDLFRKYIAYSKQKCKPKLTNEAVEEIKNFYVKLRNMQSVGESNSIPISARQLQGLIRLAEAHAKSRLSLTVEKEDAQVAIRLTNYYLMQVGYDSETKTFDIDRFSISTSSSQRNKIILVKETIKKLEEQHGNMIPLDLLKKEIGKNLSDIEFEEALEKLKKIGDIFQPKSGFVQLI